MTNPREYHALDTLKPVAENVWIVDGKTIRLSEGLRVILAHDRWYKTNGAGVAPGAGLGSPEQA